MTLRFKHKEVLPKDPYWMSGTAGIQTPVFNMKGNDLTTRAQHCLVAFIDCMCVVINPKTNVTKLRVNE